MRNTYSAANADFHPIKLAKAELVAESILTPASQLILGSAMGFSLYGDVPIREFPPQVRSIQQFKSLVERPKGWALHKPAGALFHRQLVITPHNLATADGGHHLRKLRFKDADFAGRGNLAEL